jgi:hypothetical protein
MAITIWDAALAASSQSESFFSCNARRASGVNSWFASL